MGIPDGFFGPLQTRRQGSEDSSLPYFGDRGPVLGGETAENQQYMGSTVSAGYSGTPLSASLSFLIIILQAQSTARNPAGSQS